MQHYVQALGGLSSSSSSSFSCLATSSNPYTIAVVTGATEGTTEGTTEDTTPVPRVHTWDDIPVYKRPPVHELGRRRSRTPTTGPARRQPLSAA
jgi:hypothetical protein